MRAGALLLVLSFTACKSELQKQHEALGAALIQPVARMCLVNGEKEAGGCNGDCPVFRDAQQARGAVIVGEQLSQLPPQPDAETEALLAKVRAAAKTLVEEVAPSCQEKVDRGAPPTPANRACVALWHTKHPRFAELTETVQALATSAKLRSGSELPTNPGSCEALSSVRLR